MRFLQRPGTPAQTEAAVAGTFLTALGVLSFIGAREDAGRQSVGRR
jgi:hypothetical protein